MDNLYNELDVLQEQMNSLAYNYLNELYTWDEIDKMEDYTNIKEQRDNVAKKIINNLKVENKFEPIYIGKELEYYVATTSETQLGYLKDVIEIKSYNQYLKFQFLNNTMDYWEIIFMLSIRPNGGAVIGEVKNYK